MQLLQHSVDITLKPFLHAKLKVCSNVHAKVTIKTYPILTQPRFFAQLDFL